MKIDVHTIENGKWKENTYIVSNDHRQAVIIDPGENTDGVVEIISEQTLTVNAILNTHGHYDHVAGVSKLKDLFMVPFYLHSEDVKLLRAANFYRKLFEGGANIAVPVVDRDLKDAPPLVVDTMTFEFIPTPGHTEGGVTIKIGEKIFTGDNLIYNKIGRTDLPGGNREKLIESIRKLFMLSPATEVYPGHGPRTDLQSILESNSDLLSAISDKAVGELK